MMIFYKANKTFNRIQTIDIDQEEETYVIINGMIERKITPYYGYFKTKEEAKAHMEANRHLGKIVITMNGDNR